MSGIQQIITTLIVDFQIRNVRCIYLAAVLVWKRERHYLMAINNDSAQRKTNTFIILVSSVSLFSSLTLYGLHFWLVILSSCQL